MVVDGLLAIGYWLIAVAQVLLVYKRQAPASDKADGRQYEKKCYSVSSGYFLR